MEEKYSKNESEQVSKQTSKKKKWKTAVLTVVLLLFVLVGSVAAFLWSKLDLIQYDDGRNPAASTEIPPQQGTASGPIGELPGTASPTPEGTQPQAPIEDEDDIKIDTSGLEIVEPAPVPGPEVLDNLEVFEDSNVLNILVLGTDERTTGFSSARSDCMMLVSIDHKRDTVKLVSLERAIGVPVLEGVYAGEYDLLTHIFRYGGAELVRKTVEYCFGVDVDHYVRVNFTSVIKAIDAIGGVDINLSAKEVKALNGEVHTNSTTRVPVHEGINHLDGYDALQYVRQRYVDSDWQRVQRQRKLVLAVVEELKDSSLLELNNLANTVLPLVQTNLTKLEIAELMLYVPKFLKSDFDQMTIPKQGTYGAMTCMKGRSAFAVDYEINNDLLHRFLYEGATSKELLAK